MRTTIQPLSPEWHEYRRTRVSATDVAKILGIAPASQGTALEVWQRITGKADPKEFKESDEVVFGSLSEQLNAELYVRKFLQGGIAQRAVIRPGGFWVDDEFEWLCASPDGFVRSTREASEPGVWEAKAPSHGHSAWDDDEVPDHYLCQVFAQMRVCGLKWGSISALMQPVVEVRDVELERDFMEFIMEALVDFWETKVLKDQRPDPGASEADARALARMHKPRAGKRIFLPPSLAEQLPKYQETLETVKVLNERIDLFKNHLRAIAVDANAEEIVSPDLSVGWTYKMRAGYTRPASEVEAGYVLNPMKKVKTRELE